MVESTSVRLARIEEKLDHIIESGQHIDKFLFGNGKPGFVQDVNSVCASMRTRLDNYDGSLDTIKWAIGFIGVTGSIAIGKLLLF